MSSPDAIYRSRWRRRSAVWAAAVLCAVLSVCARADATSEETANALLAARPSMVGRSFDNPMSVQGRFEDEYRAASSQWGRDSLQAADALMLLGHATVDAWDKRKHYDRALKITTKELGEDHDLYGRYLMEASASLIEYDAYRRSDDYLDRAGAFFTALPAADPVGAAQVPLHRGFLSERKNKLDDAARWFALAAQMLEPLSDQAEAQELLKSAHSSAVRALELDGNRDAATPHCVALARLAATDGNAMPQQLLLVPPQYPGKLLRNGIEGAVTFTFRVDETGIIDDVTIENIEGPDAFGEALLEATPRWRFSPRLENGEPVSARLRNRYLFTREESQSQ